LDTTLRIIPAPRYQAYSFERSLLDQGTYARESVSFGTAGLVTIDFFGATDNARDLAIQSDGNILVVGSAVNGSAGLAMARIAS